MRRTYSRRAKSEEKKNIRRAMGLGVLTVGLIAFILFFGVPLIVKYAGLLTDLNSSSTAIDVDDTTPPPPPRFDVLPEFTNQKSIDINGNAEPGSTVLIQHNQVEKDVLANKTGRFSLNITLIPGANKLSAKAKDSHGNESTQTDTYTVEFDSEPPELTIESPEDGSSFFGSRQRQITIQGTTEPDTDIHINERFVIVSGTGTFSYTTTLSEGDNSFTIKAEDQAGNATEASLTLSYSP